MRLGLTTGPNGPPSLNPRNPAASQHASPISLLISKIQARQSSPTFIAIPSTYGQTGGPSPGAVAGIVLGAVAAFLLVLYLVYAILHGGPAVMFRNNGGSNGDDGGESTVGSRSVVSFRTRDTRRTSRRRSSHRNSRAETVEVRRSRGTPVTIVEPPAPPRAPPPRTVSPLSDDDEIDVVIVEEEEPTPPRRGSQRGWRRDSGHRDVDPGLYAGGYEPVVNVRRGSGRYARDR